MQEQLGRKKKKRDLYPEAMAAAKKGSDNNRSVVVVSADADVRVDRYKKCFYHYLCYLCCNLRTLVGLGMFRRRLITQEESYSTKKVILICYQATLDLLSRHRRTRGRR